MVARARTRGYAAQDPAWDSSPGGEGKEGVDRGFEGTRVPLDLGEQEAALDRGEEGDGEVIRVGPVWEMPGFAEVSQPVSDGGGPLPEPAGNHGAGPGVAFGELAAE